MGRISNNQCDRRGNEFPFNWSTPSSGKIRWRLMMYEGQAMFPPVLTTEGARGWAARPGSRDDPTRGDPVAPRNFARKGLLARARPISTAWSLRQLRPRIASHVPVREVQIIGVSTGYRESR